MAWFSKQKKMKTKESTPAAPPPPAAKGEGIWYKCDACEGVVARAEWEKAWNVCPSCGQHDALPLRRRMDLVLDPGSFQELDAELTPHANMATQSSTPRIRITPSPVSIPPVPAVA